MLEDSYGNHLEDAIESFIKQFYVDDTYIPKEIFIDREIPDETVIEDWLSQKRGNRVYIKVPKRGAKRRLVDLAAKNANETAQNIEQRDRYKERRTVGACRELAEYLELESVPYRIEAFDISNIQGVESVASMVVFEGGKAKEGLQAL